MKKMPDSVREYVSNAEYFLEAAGRFPSPTKDAVQILLLLIGWENIVLADEELRAWAKEEEVEDKVYRSHARKFRSVPEVTRIIVDSTGKPKEKRFSSGKDFEDLRNVCQYGSNTETKDVSSLFKSGWYLDQLLIGLQRRIGLIRTAVRAYEVLEIKGRT